jgi:hypothetical protein
MRAAFSSRACPRVIWLVIWARRAGG